MQSIYSPAEDSFLMSEVLESNLPLPINKNIKFLEIGVGSGIQLETARELGIKNIFGVDINPDAVAHCRKLGFKCKKSNLFNSISGKFDLIVFNPPYLPQNKLEPIESQKATTGGKTGSEIINKFLKKAKKYINTDGKIFLLVSSLTKKINWQNWKKKKLAEKKLFFEKIEVYELRQ